MRIQMMLKIYKVSKICILSRVLITNKQNTKKINFFKLVTKKLIKKDLLENTSFICKSKYYYYLKIHIFIQGCHFTWKPGI